MGQPIGMDALGLRRIAGQAAQLLSAEAAGLIPAAVNGSRGAGGLGERETKRVCRLACAVGQPRQNLDGSPRL